MAYIRFYDPYFSACRDENANEAYEELNHRINSGSYCGCNQGNVPSANITETEKEYRIEMALPGVDKKNITVKHENGYLSVIVNKPEGQESEQTFNRHEFDYSGSTRTFKTGDKIDTEKIEAKYENGILAVTLPKREAFINKPARSIIVI